MNQSAKTALAVVVVIALAGAFWVLLLSPKREKASELSEQTATLRAEVSTEEARANSSLAAKRQFPRYYRELVLLGKAVPAEAATPSLLVQLNGVSAHAATSFESIVAGGEGGSDSANAEGSTEAPLGSKVGPAGLTSMAYTLEFEGGFFGIAKFIHGLDSFVKTKKGVIDAEGRLVTIDSFTLSPIELGPNGQEKLLATFDVSTYVTPPGQGLTAGATASGPATETSTTE